MQRVFLALAIALAQWWIPVPAAAAVNINTATLEEFVALHKGLGPAKAQAIIDYRKQNGPFKSVDDLKHVKGIGAKRLEKLRPELTVGPAPKVAAAGATKAEAKGTVAPAKGEIRAAADTARK
jgi:competence protein ComEA